MPPADAHAPQPVTDTFDAVYRSHMPAVLRYLRRRLGDATGEDATHDVFVRAFDRYATYDPGRGPIIAWLFGIAANVVADHHRQERRRLEAIERDARTGQVRHTPQHDIDQLSPALAAALRNLSLGDRETLLLIVWGELSYDETAVALDIPIGTVRSRVSRARSALRTSITATTPTGPAPVENGNAHA